jgi:hypothetical protein
MLEVRSGGSKVGGENNNKERGSGSGKRDRYEMMLESCLKRAEWERNEENPDVKKEEEKDFI